MAKSTSVSDNGNGQNVHRSQHHQDKRGSKGIATVKEKERGKRREEGGSKVVDGEGKKKKRKRNADGGDGEKQSVEEQADSDKSEKKSKKKRKDSPHPEQSSTLVVEPEPVVEQPKKKKRRSKGKERADVDIAIDPQITQAESGVDVQEEHSNHSDEAFVAAVVAAATSTTGQHQQPHGNMEYANYPMYAQMPPNYPAPPNVFPHQYSGQIVTQPHETTATQSQAQAPDANPLSDAAILESLGLNLQNNEEVLRTLQELDITKIANMLKSLGDAASASIASAMYQAPVPGPSNGPAVVPRPAPVRKKVGPKQTSVPSALLLGQPSRNPENAGMLPVHLGAMGVPLPNQQVPVDPEHQFMLANKWMSATKLGELAKTKGLVYKKGKFSTLEEQHLKNAIETYRFNKSLSHDQLNEIIFAKEKRRDNQFWSEITGNVPGRPIIAVYHHVRRTYHPLKQQGKWMPAEDESLIQAVEQYGQSWEKVSEKVGRMASDCRDRWRNHLSNRNLRTHGQWSKDEEDLLTQIVTEMTIAQGKDQDNDVFWGIVAQRMGNRRSRQQCRIKWTDSLSKLVKNEGQKPRWCPQDAYILVHKIASLNVHDDSEIDWKTLPDDDWNLWSAHSLQRRWLTLKRGIKGYEEMSHQEIVDILRVKKAHIPPAPPAARKPRVMSSLTVTEGVPSDGVHGTPQTAVAVHQQQHVQHQQHPPQAGPSPVAAQQAVPHNNALVQVVEKDAEEDIGSSSEEEDDDADEKEKKDGNKDDDANDDDEGSSSSPSSSSSSSSSSEDEDEDSSSSSDSD